MLTTVAALTAEIEKAETESARGCGCSDVLYEARLRSGFRFLSRRRRRVQPDRYRGRLLPLWSSRMALKVAQDFRIRLACVASCTRKRKTPKCDALRGLGCDVSRGARQCQHPTHRFRR